jgi:hypothetical protein
VVKPEFVEVPEAKIEQCRSEDILENSKCVLVNYTELKKENRSLRAVIDTFK